MLNRIQRGLGPVWRDRLGDDCGSVVIQWIERPAPHSGRMSVATRFPYENIGGCWFFIFSQGSPMRLTAGLTIEAPIYSALY